MNSCLNFKNIIYAITLLFLHSLTAQEGLTSNNSNNKSVLKGDRAQKYQQLQKLGYKESEIYKDLGNVNFLKQNYQEAIFWYTRLKEISIQTSNDKNFQERYQYALEKTKFKDAKNNNEGKDWLAQIKSEYQVFTDTITNKTTFKKASKSSDLSFYQYQTAVDSQTLTLEDLGLENEVTPNHKKEDFTFFYNAPIAITKDGLTAYFSRAIYTKASVGIFSKKEIVYKIYKAHKVNDKWQDIKELALAPKNYSAIHPAITPDGNRLFFASNMPGTFGKYDIYAADLQKDGSFGPSKNLGQKVNTDENDLYPKIIGESTLVFASEGRQGFGGLDVFMTQVNHKKVSASVNLGENVNSIDDDFSILITSKKGTAYVMSNRGKNKSTPQRIYFNFPSNLKEILLEKKQFNSPENFHSNFQIDYSKNIFHE